jgi:hypothetical protein
VRRRGRPVRRRGRPVRRVARACASRGTHPLGRAAKALVAACIWTIGAHRIGTRAPLTDSVRPLMREAISGPQRQSAGASD